MCLKDQRPVNLNLFTIRFPVTAIVSIGHRASGVLLFLTIPFILWTFESSLFSEASFQVMQAFMQHGLVKCAVWLTGVALVYHCVAGIRHLLMDIGFGEHFPAARTGAFVVMMVSSLFAIAWAVWLWEL